MAVQKEHIRLDMDKQELEDFYEKTSDRTCGFGGVSDCRMRRINKNERGCYLLGSFAVVERNQDNQRRPA
jgi:hypothetical protein